MAADCVTRVWALAIATAACIGLPSALIYAIVRIAAARRYGATFALGLVLVFWVTVSAAYYPRVCAELLVPALRFRRLARHLRGHGDGEPSLLVPQRSSFVTTDVFPRPRQAPPPAPAARGGAGARVRAADDVSSAPSPYPFEHQRVPLAQRYGDRGGGGIMGVLFPWEAAPAAARGGASASGAVIGVPPPRYPLYEQPRVPFTQQSHGDRASTSRRVMAALPREPPAARGKACAGDDVPQPPCEQSDGGGPSKYCCLICLTDVDEEETAKRLPLCLHVFHRQCIDQWLQLGHSTCPICRCNGGDRRGGMMGAYNGYCGAAGASSNRMMAALPREPPAVRGKARVGAGDDGVVPRPPPCEEQSDGGPSKYCPICMTDVDEEDTAKRLPLCLHVFHRQCIDQWLQLGHSKCPTCRCNAFLSDSWPLGSS